MVNVLTWIALMNFMGINNSYFVSANKKQLWCIEVP